MRNTHHALTIAAEVGPSIRSLIRITHLARQVDGLNPVHGRQGDVAAGINGGQLVGSGIEIQANEDGIVRRPTAGWSRRR